MGETVRVDEERLWESLMAMARFGATPGGGSCRLALSDEDRRARDCFVAWCRAAGCVVSVDRMGNLFARRGGRDVARPPVVAGSHLDTQPHGGKFDGVYGVLAGLEVIRTLNDHAIETRAPVEVAVWTNEEGVRFAPAMLASGVFAGVFDLEYGLSRADASGTTVGEELARIGYAGDNACGGRPLGAFFEAHIEQGPILEREGKTIGVVLGGQGVLWYDVAVTGEDAHAGSTPMAGRRDALVGAAAMITSVREMASRVPGAVATVGSLRVEPDSRNTIPGAVRFTLDLRHFEAARLEDLGRRSQEACTELARAEGLEVELEDVWHQPPVEFDPGCIRAVREAAEKLGLSHRDIVSGAGHDAFLISRVAPSGMIFVPCAGGRSHNEAESATAPDLAAGCDVLLHAMMETAGVV